MVVKTIAFRRIDANAYMILLLFRNINIFFSFVNFFYKKVLQIATVT